MKKGMEKGMKYIKRAMAWLLAVTMLVTSVDYVQAAEAVQEKLETMHTEVSQGGSSAVSVSDNQVLEENASKQTVSGNGATADSFDVTDGDVSEGDVSESDVSESDVSGGNFIEDSVSVVYGLSRSGEVLYSGTEAGITWSITSDGLLTIEGEYDAESGESITLSWLTYKTQIKKAVVTAKKVKSTGSWFSGCTNLAEIDVKGLDTSAATSMSYMFEKCSSLTSLDLSGLDTSNVTNMGGMFSGCSNLTSLDLRGLDTSNVKEMHFLFKGCRSLTGLDLSGFDTGNVTTMYGTFWNCKGLTSLDVNSWDTGNVTTMTLMFASCEGLASLDVSGWDTGRVTSMYSMFTNCSGLTSLDVSGFKTDNVTDMSNMFYDCSGLASLDVSGFKTDNVTDMSYMFSGCDGLMELQCMPALQLDCDLPHTMQDKDGMEYTALPKGLVEGIWIYAQDYIGGEISGIKWTLQGNGNLIISGEYNGTPITGTELPWHAYTDDIKSANITAQKVESTANWFDGCDELRSVLLSGFDSSKVTNMEAMFRNCVSLSSVDVSVLDMSKVTNANEMFLGCSRLASVDVFKNLQISIALPHYMLSGNMGQYTEYIEFPLNIQDDLQLKRGDYRGSLDGLRWYIIERDGVLYITGENAATELPEESTTYMWTNSSYLYSKVIVDTKGVLSTARWFKDCTKITELDLSGFDTTSLVETTDMLTGCTGLEKVKTAPNLKVSMTFPTTMYDEKATAYVESPLNLTESLEIFKEEPAGTIQGLSWMLLEDGTLVIGGTDTSTTVSDSTTWPWHEYSDDIKKVKIYAKNVKSTAYWFAGCSNLTEADLSEFDMQTVTVSTQMFEGCTNLIKLQTPLYVKIDIELPVGMLDGDETVYLNLPKEQSKSITLNATRTYYGMSWVILQDGTLLITGTYSAASDKDTSWLDYPAQIKSVKVSATGVKSTANWFYGLSKLETVDFSGFDTSLVTDMSGMFRGCSSLKSLDLSNFNTGNVTNMWGMFYNCYALTGVDLSKFDTSKVTDMGYLFNNCRALETLDLSKFDLSKLTTAERFLEGCNEIGKINTPQNLGLEIALPVGMVDEEQNIYLTLPMSLAESIVLDATQMVTLGSYNGLVWALLKDGTLLITGSYAEASDTDTSWLDYATQITSVKVVATGVKSTANWFYGLSKLETVDFSGFDTSLVTDMSGMFRGCSSLKSLDLSNFNTGNVTNMWGMFYNCYALTGVDLSKFDTSKVTDMGYLFNNCRALETLDLSKFDLSKLTTAEHFWEGCSEIGKINTPQNLGLEIALPVGMVDEEQNIYLTLPMSLAESIVLDATQMVTLGSYNGLVWALLKDGTLIIGGTDTSTTVSGSATWPWHEYLDDVKKVKIYAKNVKSTAFWFSGCIHLTETDFSGFKTSTVKNMRGMFQNCSSLESLDLSGFNMWSVSSAEGMFDGCIKLKKIKTPLYVRNEVELPCGMLDADKNVYLILPMELTKSIALDGEQVVAAGRYCGMIWVVLKDGTLLITGSYAEASDTDTSWLDYATQITSVKVVATGVTSTANWFYGLSRLETVDISSFDTSLVTDMSGMFRGCSSLTSLDIGSFDTAQVTNMAELFKDCSALTALDISKFDTSKVMDMSEMFSGCGSLTKLDLAHFAFSEDMDVSGLLMGCVGLEEIQMPAELKVDISVPKTLYNYLGEPQTDCFPKYQPEAERYYAVSPVNEGEIHVSKVYPQTYTGKTIKPEIRIYDGANRLLDKKDFTITYKNNTKAASKDAVNDKGKSIAPTIIVKGKGNYTKSETITFDILAKDISDEDVIAQELVAVEGKKVQLPVPKLTYNGKKLVKGKDFDISYPDLENKSKTDAYKIAGTYRVKITGIGNFAGTRELVFTITDGALMSKVKVAKIAAQEYTGKAVEPAVKVTYKREELVAGEDYKITYKNNTEIGKASVILTGIGDYAGTKTVTFQITGQSIAKATVSGIEDKVYNGQEQTQSVKVDLNNVPLKVDRDYEVTYSKNTDVGKATVTITGKGAYSGVVKKTFKIKPYDLKENNKKLFKGVPSNLRVAYEKGGSTPELELTFGGVNMAVKKDYTLSYANNKVLATSKDDKAPTITIKGKGNFTGTVTVPFTIVAKSLQDTENPVAIHVADVAYASKAGKYVSKPVLTDSNGKKLVAGRDYENVYTKMDGTVLDKTSKVDAGTTIKIKVTGKGCYTGTMETTYQITPAAFKSAKIKIEPKVYTGKAVTISKEDITVTMGKEELTYGEGYEIVEGSYKNNIKKGTASVTIKGLGNYGGEKTVKFRIVPKELVWFWRLFS